MLWWHHLYSFFTLHHICDEIKTGKFWGELINIENGTSNDYSIAVCVFVAVERFY
jgi:hypothetical protein